ncbi:MAG: hypothetical protein JO247_12930, partial [Chloroflexi bacterium]|nr:hypothetical protein [Chloroflexota bacterium]
MNDGSFASTGATATAVAAAYDFSWRKTLVDVGGSNALAAGVAQANPHVRASVLDLPCCREMAPSTTWPRRACR